MYLTKTDYIHYLNCPKSLWLKKHRPEEYPKKDFSLFLQKIARDGYEVERYAQRLFQGGVSLPSGPAAEQKTREALARNVPVLFQATVQTDDGLFVRADVLERVDGGYHLYEVKSSTSVRWRGGQHNHIKDVCFQKIAFERAGVPILKSFIIHANGAYVRGSEVDPRGLLTVVDVTDAVLQVVSETEVEVDNAVGRLRVTDDDADGCSCRRKTRSNHCDAFSYFNGDLVPGSVWEIGNIREGKLLGLLESGIVSLQDVPSDSDLNDRQMLQVRSAIEGRPIIDEQCIAAILESMVFPLYFFDYETAMSAVPKVVGTRPWQQLPFQFSLHVLEEDGSLSHHEYLSDVLDGTEDLLRALRDALGPEGSVVSWHASFEKTRNVEIAEMYPQYRSFLENMNDRTVDLEDVFKGGYVDASFRGSSSIKKVLPVLCPQLSYADLGVQDGTQAMEQWFAMVEGDLDADARSAIRRDLLAYCKMDTFAMVALYRYLAQLVSDGS